LAADLVETFEKASERLDVHPTDPLADPLDGKGSNLADLEPGFQWKAGLGAKNSSKALIN